MTTTAARKHDWNKGFMNDMGCTLDALATEIQQFDRIALLEPHQRQIKALGKGLGKGTLRLEEQEDACVCRCHSTEEIELCRDCPCRVRWEEILVRARKLLSEIARVESIEVKRVSRERIRQIEAIALLKARKACLRRRLLPEIVAPAYGPHRNAEDYA